MQQIAVITRPDVIRAFLKSVGLAAAPPTPAAEPSQACIL
jgi:hypothetical protein